MADEVLAVRTAGFLDALAYRTVPEPAAADLQLTPAEVAKVVVAAVQMRDAIYYLHDAPAFIETAPDSVLIAYASLHAALERLAHP